MSKPKMKNHNKSGAIRSAEAYYGKAALLATWENEREDVQALEHDYLLELRARVRNCYTRVVYATRNSELDDHFQG